MEGPLRSQGMAEPYLTTLRRVVDDWKVVSTRGQRAATAVVNELVQSTCVGAGRLQPAFFIFCPWARR